MLDMTVMCTSGVMAPPPGIPTLDVLPLTTVVSTMDAVSTSTPFVVPPAPVVERPGKQAQEFSTCRLAKSLEFLPLFRLLSSSPAPTLPRGSAKDSSPPFSLDRVQVGHSQEVPGEDSLFSVSPLSPGIFLQPPRGSTSLRLEGPCCRRRQMTVWFRDLVIRSLLRGVNSIQRQNPLGPCLDV